MTPYAIIVTAPLLNKEQFLTSCQEMLGYSPARAADSANLAGIKYLLAVFSSFKNNTTSPTTVKNSKEVYNLLNINCLIASDEYEMLQILEIISGMKFALTETTRRVIHAIIVNGTLIEWRDAIRRGCKRSQPTLIRACFNQLYIQFTQLGLEPIFNGVKKHASDQTFYLESE
jgi:hypothetical protein